MTTIGFIGLGHMGQPMVNNLIKNNCLVKVYDVIDEAVEKAVKTGATAAASPAEVAEEADVVFTMLQTSDQVRNCCLSAKGIFATINRQAIYIDSSSIDIEGSRELHKEAKKRGISMLDAPVSGGVAAAEAAGLTFMVGGEKEDFEPAKRVRGILGKKIIYAGSDGAGAAAKICNNMLLGISMIAVSEAFVLADKLGLDPQKLFEISSNASGECWSLTHYCPWPGILKDVPSSHEYKPGFTAKMMLKDLNLSQAAASDAKANTPLGKRATELYQQFVDSDHGEVDFSAVINLLKDKSQ
ncbi:3-hydroxyisobutyrate dehydrogenase [Coxiella burnetii]|uniref:3-hydroxyisobutyrate dehydrogenase n=1 Tax=Coxiella burnetii TaxID=777 RepID=UPI0021AD7881|nr:3-hydroxyisobutyrate dehydrogenase [Coxiella burnetii]